MPPCDETVSRITGAHSFLPTFSCCVRAASNQNLCCRPGTCRKRVTCALGINGQSLCFIARPSGREKSRLAWRLSTRTSLIDRQPVMRRPSARDAVGGSQDLFVVPSTDRHACSLSGSHFYYLRKLRSMPDRLGWLSFRSALASICSQWLIEQSRSAAAED